MKIQIDTNKKEIIIIESCTMKELYDLLVALNIEDYSIASNSTLLPMTPGNDFNAIPRWNGGLTAPTYPNLPTITFC